MTKDEFQKAVDDAITDCIRNDCAFGSYAHKVTEAVWPLLEAAEKERDAAELMSLALRAKIEQMEQQEPVKHEFQGRDGAWYPFIDQRHHENTVADGSWPIRALYALPGAQGEEK